MIKALQVIWKDIREGDNLDLYIAVAAAISVAVLGLFGLGTSFISSITLAVLALFATSTLVNRRRLEEVITRIDQAKNEPLLTDYPPEYQKDMLSSDNIFLVGLYLDRTITENYPIFEQKLKSGAHIRVLILHPSEAVSKMFVQRATRPISPQQGQNGIQSRLSDLCSLKSIAPSQIEIRTIDYLLPFGALAVNLNKSSAKIYIEHYSYKMIQDAPRMVLTPQDKRWFGFYEEQLGKLWSDATEWRC